MIQVSEELRDAVDQTASILPQAIAAALTFLAFAFAGRLAGIAITRFAGDKASARVSRVARRVLHWTLSIFGLVISLNILYLTAIAG